MPEESESLLKEALARHELDLARLKEAFALLGVSPCSRCQKFHRGAEAGALFDAGELICYGCLHEWWPQHSVQLGRKERQDLEGKLVFWLRDYHHAELFKDQVKLPDAALQELNLVASCLECRGTGKIMGDERCRYCDGRGTVWVIVSRKKS